MIPKMIDETITELTAAVYRRDHTFVHLHRWQRERLASALRDVLTSAKVEQHLLMSKGEAERRQLAAVYHRAPSTTAVANLHAQVFTSFMELLGQGEPPTNDMRALSKFVLNLIVVLAERGAIAAVNVAQPRAEERLVKLGNGQPQPRGLNS